MRPPILLSLTLMLATSVAVAERPAESRSARLRAAAPKWNRSAQPRVSASKVILTAYLQEATEPIPSTPPPRPPATTEPASPADPPVTTTPPAPPERVPETPPPTPQPDNTVLPPPRSDAPPETYAPPAPPVDSGPASPPNPTAIDWCLPPANLTMSEGELLSMLGYSPAHCFVYSQRNCFELALSCYRRGLNADAIAIAEHGLRHGHYSPLLLIRGAAQTASGACSGAQDSARQIYGGKDYVNSRTYDNALERISGPDIGRVRELIQLYEGR